MKKLPIYLCIGIDLKNNFNNFNKKLFNTWIKKNYFRNFKKIQLNYKIKKFLIKINLKFR